MSDQQQTDQSLTPPNIHYFSFWKKMAHVLPGFVTLIAFISLKPYVTNAGYPPLMAFTLAVLFFDLPLLLGIILVQGRKLNQRWSLKGVIGNLERTKAGKFFGIVLVGIGLAIGLFAIGSPIERFMASLFTSILPDWMYLDHVKQYSNYPRSVLMQTVLLWAVVTGIVLPVVEEVYFRGYLLPRMSSSRINAIVANAGLFALYHAWHPYGLLTFFLQGLLFSTFVLLYRNIRFSIAWHVIGNLQLRIMIMISLLVS